MSLSKILNKLLLIALDFCCQSNSLLFDNIFNHSVIFLSFSAINDIVSPVCSNSLYCCSHSLFFELLDNNSSCSMSFSLLSISLISFCNSLSFIYIPSILKRVQLPKKLLKLIILVIYIFYIYCILLLLILYFLDYQHFCQLVFRLFVYIVPNHLYKYFDSF